jgi:hypothetical protein
MPQYFAVTEKPKYGMLLHVALPFAVAGLALAGLFFFFSSDESETLADNAATAAPAARNPFSLQKARRGKGIWQVQCSLTPCPANAGGEPAPDLRFEVTNTLEQQVRLKHVVPPLFRVTFRLRDMNDNIIEMFYWGDLALKNPAALDSGKSDDIDAVFTLNAGKTYGEALYLSKLQQHFEVPTGPGRYKLEAIFDSLGYLGAGDQLQRFVGNAQPIPVDVAAKNPGETRGKWKLILE